MRSSLALFCVPLLFAIFDHTYHQLSRAPTPHLLVEEFASVGDSLPLARLPLARPAARRGTQPRTRSSFSAVDGIGGAFQAWSRLGLHAASRVSSEIDPIASRVARAAWPGVVELGDITLLGDAELRRLVDSAPRARLCIVVAGFPCQDLSRLNACRRSRSGARSVLFRELRLRISRIKELIPI